MLELNLLFCYFQLEEERQQQKERRKKNKEKLLDKKRNLTGLVKDAQKKTADYEKKVKYIFPAVHFLFLNKNVLY